MRNKIILLVGGLMILALIVLAWIVQRDNVQSDDQFTVAEPEITNFQECVTAGNPVIESYPRQCRFGDQVFTEKVSDKYVQQNGPVNYSVNYPFGLFAYENGPNVIFSTQSKLELPLDSGEPIGPHFSIFLHLITGADGIKTIDDWLAVNGLYASGTRPEIVEINGYKMEHVIVEGASSEGTVEHYILPLNPQLLITMSQVPYDPESELTQLFEKTVATFRLPEMQQASSTTPEDIPDTSAEE